MTKVNITYFDTAMALIEIGPIRFLTDPVLDDEGTIYDDGVVSLKKLNPARTTAAALGDLDAVLLSHDQHGDNLDNHGRELLSEVPVIVSTPEAAERLGKNVRGLNRWEQTKITKDGFTVVVTAAPAQHGPDGTEALTGTVTGFLIDTLDGLVDGPIYISGDTVPFAGTREIVSRVGHVSVALLHLGHVSPPGMAHVHLSLSANEAVEYAKALNAKHVVPLHFDGWNHFTESPANASDVFAGSEIAARVNWLKPGETVALSV